MALLSTLAYGLWGRPCLQMIKSKWNTPEDLNLLPKQRGEKQSPEWAIIPKVLFTQLQSDSMGLFPPIPPTHTPASVVVLLFWFCRYCLESTGTFFLYIYIYTRACAADNLKVLMHRQRHVNSKTYISGSASLCNTDYVSHMHVVAHAVCKEHIELLSPCPCLMAISRIRCIQTFERQVLLNNNLVG